MQYIPEEEEEYSSADLEWEAMKGWRKDDDWTSYYTRWDRDYGLRREEKP